MSIVLELGEDSMMCSCVIMFAAPAQLSISRGGSSGLNESENKIILRWRQAISFEIHLHGNEFIFIDRIACFMTEAFVRMKEKKEEGTPHADHYYYYYFRC